MKFSERIGLYDDVILYDDYRFYAKLPKSSMKCLYLDFAGVANITVKIHAHFGENLVQSILIGGSHGEMNDSEKGAAAISIRTSPAAIIKNSLQEPPGDAGHANRVGGSSSPMSPASRVGGSSPQHASFLPDVSMLPGARPRYFFVPSWLQERTILVDVLDQNVSVYEKLEASFARFLTFAESWLRIMEYSGIDEILLGYPDMLQRLKCCPDTGIVMSLWPRLQPLSSTFGMGRLYFPPLDSDDKNASSVASIKSIKSEGANSSTFARVMAIEEYYDNGQGDAGRSRTRRQDMQSRQPRKTSVDVKKKKKSFMKRLLTCSSS